MATIDPKSVGSGGHCNGVFMGTGTRNRRLSSHRSIWRCWVGEDHKMIMPGVDVDMEGFGEASMATLVHWRQRNHGTREQLSMLVSAVVYIRDGSVDKDVA